MTIDREQLGRFTEDDAFAFVIETLRKVLRQEIQLPPTNTGFDFNIRTISKLWLTGQGITEHNDVVNSDNLISGKFYSAFWSLCLRGILRPSVRSLGATSTNQAVPGNDYSLTEQGRAWLLDAEQEPIILSSRSLLSLLTANSIRFGSGFSERAKEAVSCFDHGCYLACCVMCGAAGEAIFLSLAVAKIGDEQEVLEKYKAASGRKYLKDLLERNQPGGLVNELSTGFGLLSYWRDNAAHGVASQVTSVNARTALSLLLGLVQTANDRWSELTTTPHKT